MPDLEPRHLAFPVELEGGRFCTNPQGSDEEVADCIAVCISYERGTRRGKPGFGVPEMVFRQGGPDIPALQAALVSNENEPRARYEIELDDDRLLEALALVEVGFDEREGS
jgi:hypothetical protein